MEQQLTLRSERIPNTVFNLRGIAIWSGRSIDGNSLLSVNRHAGGRVERDESILLTTGDEDSLVTMRFDDDLGAALHAAAASSATTSATAATSTSATSSASTASSAAIMFR